MNPGNVIKTGWDLVLAAGGEAGSTGKGNEGLDPIIREILTQGATKNRFPEAGLDFFYYHSPAYRCTGEPVRGLKEKAVVELVGLAEALAPGDELALLVYGFHPQYPVIFRLTLRLTGFRESKP